METDKHLVLLARAAAPAFMAWADEEFAELGAAKTSSQRLDALFDGLGAVFCGIHAACSVDARLGAVVPWLSIPQPAEGDLALWKYAVDRFHTADLRFTSNEAAASFVNGVFASLITRSLALKALIEKESAQIAFLGFVGYVTAQHKRKRPLDLTHQKWIKNMIPSLKFRKGVDERAVFVFKAATAGIPYDWPEVAATTKSRAADAG